MGKPPDELPADTLPPDKLPTDTFARPLSAAARLVAANDIWKEVGSK